MNKELTPIEQLDLVLKWFAMNPDEYLDIKTESRQNLIEPIIGTGMLKHFPFLKAEKFLIQNLPMLLEKLYKDRYLDSYKDRITEYGAVIPFYSANFDGRVFYQLGGYKKQKQIADANLRRTRIQNIILVLGAGIAALYYGAEFIRSYVIPFFRCH
jgi:hypothetical protein